MATEYVLAGHAEQDSELLAGQAVQVVSSRIAYVLAGHLIQDGVDEASYRKPSKQGEGCTVGLKVGTNVGKAAVGWKEGLGLGDLNAVDL